MSKNGVTQLARYATKCRYTNVTGSSNATLTLAYRDLTSCCDCGQEMVFKDFKDKIRFLRTFKDRANFFRNLRTSGRPDN